MMQLISDFITIVRAKARGIFCIIAALVAQLKEL